MAMCAFSTSYSNSSAISRLDPSYNTPNALGNISVYVNKIGKISYYVAKRYLGLVSDNVLQYTSPTAISIATNPTFTTNDLSANTKYTFVFIATDVNGYSASGTAATPRGGNGDGSIYTLADPSGLILTYNGSGSSAVAVSFIYTGTTPQTYSSLMIYNSANTLMVTPAPGYSTGAGTYTSSGTIAGVTPTVDTIYTYNVYVVNAAGLGNNMAVCMKSIQTCTTCPQMLSQQANSTNGQFCVPDTLGAIWNSSNNYSITAITIPSAGTCYKVIRSLNGIVETISEPQYSSDYSDLSTNLLTNTQYTFSLNSYNKLGYTRNTPISTMRRVTNGPPVGKIYTLNDPSGLTFTIYTEYLTGITLKYSSLYNFTQSATSDYGTPIISKSATTYLISFSVTTIPPNTAITSNYWVINADGVGDGIAACKKTITNYTGGSGPANSIKVAVPTELNSIKDGNGYTLTNFAPNGVGSYNSYVVTRTGGAGTVTSTVQTGTSYTDTSTDLLANTAYTYTYRTYNNDGYLYPTITSAGISTVNYCYSPYTSTTLTTTTIGTYTLFDNSILSVSSWTLLYYTLVTPKVWKLYVSMNAIGLPNLYCKCDATWLSTSSTQYGVTGQAFLFVLGTTIPTSGLTFTLKFYVYNSNNIINSSNPYIYVLNYN